MMMAIKLLDELVYMDKILVKNILEYAVRMHPSMAIFRNIYRMFNENVAVESIRKKLIRVDEDIARNLMKVVRRQSRIVTYSRSQTLLNVFRVINEKGYISEVIISEGRPTNEGILFAEEMASIGIRVRLVIDILLPRLVGEADYVIIGSDAILPDYTVVNKTGSYILALASRHYNKEFIVCSDEFKLINRDHIKIVYGPRSDLYRGAEANINIYNPYFEIIPREYISSIVMNSRIVRISP